MKQINSTLQQTSQELLGLYGNQLLLAHAKATLRMNSSTTALLLAYRSNGGNCAAALVAAISTLGGSHAPIQQTIEMINNIISGEKSLDDYNPIFGFGTSFNNEQGEEDILDDLKVTAMKIPGFREFLSKCYDNYTIMVKKLEPNLSLFTAFYLIAIELPPHLSTMYIAATRINGWMNILANESIEQEVKTNENQS